MVYFFISCARQPVVSEFNCCSKKILRKAVSVWRCVGEGAVVFALWVEELAMSSCCVLGQEILL